MSNVVAIIGRPNVGKSTLFNRLTGRRSAIVDQASGVTRDRHYGLSTWNGKDFDLIDTGGYVQGSDDVFEGEIRKQVNAAIQEADVLLFIVDVTVGITDLDQQVAKLLRNSKKKILVVVNKVDNNDRRDLAIEFYNLGLGEYFCISSINGSGTGDLLDELVKDFPENNSGEEESEIPRISIVGRPNVGKSSLINVLIGKERNIVTPIAGTTRDSIDTHYNAYGFDFTLIDTAGVRKKSKVHEDLEFYSVMRTVRAIDYSDVCILMIDASEGMKTQDLNLYSIIERKSKGLIIVVNKWDLIEKDQNSLRHFEDDIRSKIAPFKDVPIIFTSVLNKQRIHKVLEEALKVYQNRMKKIKTSELNDFFLPITTNNPPPSWKGKYIKIKFITQLPTHAPSFAFFCNLPQYIKEPYRRFCENKLREKFDFTGVPVKIFFRKK